MDKLIYLIEKLKSPVVVGLDTCLSYIPEYIKKKAIDKYENTPKAAAYSIINFNEKIVDAIKDIVPAVKFQIACYETFGHWGIYALEKSCDYAKKNGMYVIIDAKRNDIKISMEHYINAYLGETELFNKKSYSPFKADCMTINPYLGSDSIKPAVEAAIKYDKDIFVLVKTSNPSSNEIQDIKDKDETLVYEKIGAICEELSKETIGKYGYSRVGAVVGATHKDVLKKLRGRLKTTFFLVPGYGAQKGSAKDVSVCFKDGIGAIINSSRQILTAWQKTNEKEENFAKSARKEAEIMKININKYIL